MLFDFYFKWDFNKEFGVISCIFLLLIIQNKISFLFIFKKGAGLISHKKFDIVMWNMKLKTIKFKHHSINCYFLPISHIPLSYIINLSFFKYDLCCILNCEICKLNIYIFLKFRVNFESVKWYLPKANTEIVGILLKISVVIWMKRDFYCAFGS